MTEVIQPEDTLDTRERGYSQARIDDGVLFTSGIASRQSDGWIAHGDDIETQAAHVFDTLETVLAEVDKDLSDVSKVTTYLIDVPRDSEGYLEVWNERFDDPYPCHTLLGVNELAVPEFLVEIDAEVVL
ncbi:MAG: RidA family protein [Halobacteriales archaeon]|nr:RidA family protein [Halobacteriales archaeon]